MCEARDLDKDVEKAVGSKEKSFGFERDIEEKLVEGNKQCWGMRL